MKPEEAIKLFSLSSQQVEKELDGVERQLQIDLGRPKEGQPDQDETYYPQFSESIRNEASLIAAHYELFYCLENSIRALVREKLTAEHGSNWWSTAVPLEVQKEAAANMKKEVDSGFTPRSTEEIDYTTFGQLGDIVRNNWKTFGDTFNSDKAFSKVMTNLNTLRGPIAHCSPLAPDEVLRLRLALKDWFRLME